MTTSLIGAPCSRCTQLFVGFGDWNITVEGGRVVGLLCPSCQTAEEHLEAAVNLATTDYYVGDDGVLMGRSKGAT